MSGYDYNRALITQKAMDSFRAIDIETASRIGRNVKATELSNIEYKT